MVFTEGGQGGPKSWSKLKDTKISLIIWIDIFPQKPNGIIHHFKGVSQTIFYLGSIPLYIIIYSYV